MKFVALASFLLLPPLIVAQGEVEPAKNYLKDKRFYDAITEAERELLQAKDENRKKALLEIIAISAYRVGDNFKINRIGEEYKDIDSILKEPNFLFINSVKNGSIEESEKYYRIIFPGLEHPPYPKLYDVEKAKRLSTYFPGLGMFYLDNAAKGIGIILLEGVLAGLTYYFWQEKIFGASLVSLFGFYRYYNGNIRATLEEAQINNDTLKKVFLNDAAYKIEKSLFTF